MPEYSPSKIDEEAYIYFTGPLTPDEQLDDLDSQKAFHAISYRAYYRIHYALALDEAKSAQSLRHISTLYAARCAAQYLADLPYDKFGVDLYNSDAPDLIEKSEPSDEFLTKLRELPGDKDLVEELEEQIHAGKFDQIFPFSQKGPIIGKQKAA